MYHCWPLGTDPFKFKLNEQGFWTNESESDHDDHDHDDHDHDDHDRDDDDWEPARARDSLLPPLGKAETLESGNRSRRDVVLALHHRKHL